MRPHEDPRASKPRIGAAANLLDPTQHEPRFVRIRRHDRTHVQEERLVGGKPDRLTERRAVARRRPIEPLVVALRAGNGDAIRGHAVPPDRFLLLRLVPEQDAVGHVAQQRLARQVVPAEDADAGAPAKRTGGAQMIDLRQPPRRHRRQQHDVGIVLCR